MTAVTPPSTQPWTVRVAMWSARHRWPVAALWFVCTIGLFIVSAAMGGTRSQEAVTTDQRAKYESTKAWDVFGKTAAQQAPSAQAMLVVKGSRGATTDPGFRSQIESMVGRMQSLQSTAGGASGPVFSELIDPFSAPPTAGLVSPDGSSVRIVGQVPGDGQILADRLRPLPGLVDELRAASPGLEIHVLNNTLANAEIQTLVNTDLDGSLRLTIPLTFFILLIAFGAVVAAIVPLLLAVTSLLAAFGVLAIYSQVVSPVSPYATQLIVLIGLAVAVDYSLFMITRFRTERRRHQRASGEIPTLPVLVRRVVLAVVGLGALGAAAILDGPARYAGVVLLVGLVIFGLWRVAERGGGVEQLRSIETASSTAGRAVFFSGLAVMISIAGLFLLDDPLFRSMAIGTIAVVFIAVVGSLTFLPATLAILGNGLNAGRLPILGRDRPEGGGFWGRIVRFAMGRPLVLAALVSVLLLAVASPVTRLHIGQTDFTSFPDSLDAVQAVNILNEKWPQGTTLELDVVATRFDQPATKEAMATLGQRLLAIPGLSGPARTIPNADGSVGYVAVVMSGGENDLRNQDIVREVRHDVVPAVLGGLPGVQAYVTGDAAYTSDLVGFYLGGMPLVIAFVLGLSFLLLLVAFHSLVIPIKAILLNLLSTGAAYGLLVLVFQEGWLRDQLGFKPGVIEAFVPIFIFTILFGLSMDYHVFILTRIKEARDRGLPSNEAVERGISITSGTITSAAAIMVVVFAVFVTLQLVIIRQLGFGLAIAVLIDATIVRSILLPATMRLLGDWNWWMPRALSWLPRITIEGSTDEVAEAPTPS